MIALLQGLRVLLMVSYLWTEYQTGPKKVDSMEVGSEMGQSFLMVC